MPRGGKRTGAGRRATKLSRTVEPLKKVQAEEILAESEEKSAWLELLNAEMTVSVNVVVTDGETGKTETEREAVKVPDYRIRLEARKYLTDRRDGKAKQAVEVGGKDGGPIVFKLRRIGVKENANRAS